MGSKSILVQHQISVLVCWTQGPLSTRPITLQPNGRQWNLHTRTHRDLDKIWWPSSDKKWSCATRVPHSACPSRLQPASRFRSDAGWWSGLGIPRWYPNLSTQALDNSHLFWASTGQYLLSWPRLRPRQHLSPSFCKQVNLSCWICEPPHHPWE